MEHRSIAHYLFVVDAEGNPIAKSRRSVDHCKCRADVARIERDLTSAMGEGCSVEDNVGDWAAFWAARDD